MRAEKSARLGLAKNKFFLFYVLQLASVLLLATLSCGLAEEAELGLQTAPSSLRAVQAQQAEPNDLADHSCQVVLRKATPLRDDAGHLRESCDDDGVCHWNWQVEIDVATSLVKQGARASVIYHRGSDPTWWEASAQASGIGDPGFTRFSVMLEQYLPELDSSEGLELLALLRLDDPAGQTRLFDHNIVEGDFEVQKLNASNGYSLWERGGVCTHRADTAAIVFMPEPGRGQYVEHKLRAGGYLAVHYDASRLPDCRGTHNGYPAWNIEATVQFWPGGQTFSAPVIAFKNHMGQPSNDFYPIPFELEIPDDAEQVQVWMHNGSGAGQNCEAWDSNFGQNFTFEIADSLDADPCAQTRQWQIAQEQAVDYCPFYQVDSNNDASDCQVYPVVVENKITGHYGIPEDWFKTTIKVNADSQQVLAAGMYVSYFDRSDGSAQRRFIYGQQNQYGDWQAGLQYVTTTYGRSGNRELRIRDYAFFVDMRRENGRIERLWLSQGGQNYSWDDAFSSGHVTEYIAYGHIEGARDDAAVFASRWACE